MGLFGFGRDRADLLFDALKNGDLAETKRILTVNPRLALAKDERGMTPLHVAVAKGWIDATQMLLEYGGDMHAGESMLSARDDDGFTPLHSAVFMGVFVDVVYSGAASGSEEEAVANADLQGTIMIVKALVRLGADINAVDARGHTPLMHAQNLGGTNLERLLLQLGAAG